MSDYIISGDLVYATKTETININDIKPGKYSLKYDDQHDTLSLKTAVHTSDEIIDIPDSPYQTLIDEIDVFFKSETKQKFKHFGFIYKKAILLHGKPGTGKTCLISKLGDTFTKKTSGGVVFINPSFSGFLKISKMLDPKTPVLVIFEEFDANIKYSEGTLLSLLDGEDQRANTFYIFTTNFLHKIPGRLLRPGRMSNLIELTAPSMQNRLYFLEKKLPELSVKERQVWAKLTDGFTIDQLKHSILLHSCLGQNLDEVVSKIKCQDESIDEGHESRANYKEHYEKESFRSLAQALLGE